MGTIYDFSAKTLDGLEKSLADFSGQVLLVVNTASKCGFTPQYQGLEALYRKFGSQGFSVLGFPCNQFGAQEPGDAAEIDEALSTRMSLVREIVSLGLSARMGAKLKVRQPLSGVRAIIKRRRQVIDDERGN